MPTAATAVEALKAPMPKDVLRYLGDEVNALCADWAGQICEAEVAYGLAVEVDEESRLLTEITVAEALAALVRDLQDALMRRATDKAIPAARVARARGVSPQAVSRARRNGNQGCATEIADTESQG